MSKKKRRQKRLAKFEERVKFWQFYLNLGSWDVYVEIGTLTDGTMADVSRDSVSRSAVVRLHDEIPGVEVSLDEIAKHEMIHLLLADLATLAHSREATHDQLTIEEEKVVVKLSRLL